MKKKNGGMIIYAQKWKIEVIDKENNIYIVMFIFTFVIIIMVLYQV